LPENFQKFRLNLNDELRSFKTLATVLCQCHPLHPVTRAVFGGSLWKKSLLYHLPRSGMNGNIFVTDGETD